MQSRQVSRVHDIPRFGHSNNIARLASAESSDDYKAGVRQQIPFAMCSSPLLGGETAVQKHNSLPDPLKNDVTPKITLLHCSDLFLRFFCRLLRLEFF